MAHTLRVLVSCENEASPEYEADVKPNEAYYEQALARALAYLKTELGSYPPIGAQLVATVPNQLAPHLFTLAGTTYETILHSHGAEIILVFFLVLATD